eukprot:2818341-Rhodomonas_salina.1
MAGAERGVCERGSRRVDGADEEERMEGRRRRMKELRQQQQQQQCGTEARLERMVARLQQVVLGEREQERPRAVLFLFLASPAPPSTPTPPPLSLRRDSGLTARDYRSGTSRRVVLLAVVR